MKDTTVQNVAPLHQRTTNGNRSAEFITTGRIQITGGGKALLLTDKKKRVFIPDFFLNGSLHNDVVRGQIRQNGRKMTAKIIGILERARCHYTGQVRREGSRVYLKPYNSRMPYPICFEGSSCEGLVDGEYVVAVVVKFPTADNPVVSVAMKKHLGMPSSRGVERLVLTHEYNLPEEFPEEVLKEAAAIPSVISHCEISRRRDLRGDIVFTIDGPASKDFDDAVSVKRLPNGLFRLGVHIADVSHYIKPGTALDREALRRATSVYFSDGSVIPMLPPKLSDNLCSLLPNEDRLTLTCSMDIDGSGNLVSTDVFESVIQSRARLTYEQVEDLLTRNTSKAIQLDADLLRDLRLMKDVACILRQKRQAGGSLDLNVHKLVPTFNEDGDVVGVREESHLLSNILIEEAMLAANVAVTGIAKGKPFLYRIQPAPQPHSVALLRAVLEDRGYVLDGIDESDPRLLSALVKLADEGGEGEMVRLLILHAANARATYSDQALSHYNLAFNHYTHFTSPIRRFVDLCVHRLLKQYIGGAAENALPKSLESVAKWCSDRSEVADRADGDFDRWKKLQLLEREQGRVLRAFVQKVSESGFFANLERYGISIFIPFVDTSATGNELRREGFSVLEVATGQRWNIGTRFNVRVVGIDWNRRRPVVEIERSQSVRSAA